MDTADVLKMVIPERHADAATLTALFAEVTGFAPRLWAGNIIGFGRYDYRYDSGHSGTSPATGFAPRRAELVIYILSGHAEFADILAELGKYRLGKSCIYLKRLDGVNLHALRRLIRAGLDEVSKQWVVLPE